MATLNEQIKQPQSSLNLVECPVCSSPCCDPPLYSYTAFEAATHFCSVTRNADRHLRLVNSIRKLWQGETCAILRCGVCKFAFGYPFVGGDEEFYSILHEQQGYPNWRWDYDVAIREALASFDGGRILDVGAGSGMFLRQMGPNWQPYAVEASDLTIKPLESLGITVFRDLTAVASDEAGTFEVVTLFQVLEHIAEFRQVLAQCRQLLRLGGRLVVTVPDGDAMIRQEKLTGCPDMPPHHVNKWTPTSLAQVLQEAGFDTQPSIAEPPSLQNLRCSLHLRVIADATHPRSLAAQVYRISNRRLRTLLLAGLGLSALIRMLPHGRQMIEGGAFAMIGIAK